MIRAHEEADDVGEGYFASISDLMVGILFIFLLMLTVFAINYANDDVNSLKEQIARLKIENAALNSEVASLRTENAGLKGEIANLRSENDLLIRENGALLATVLRIARSYLLVAQDRDRLLDVISRNARGLEDLRGALHGEQGRLEGVRRVLLVELRSRLKSRDVEVEIDPEQGILRLSSEGLFELNEARFTPKGRENAHALLEEMARLVPCYAQASSLGSGCATPQAIFETVLIEGHTDTRRRQGSGGNWALSTDRARAFMELIGDSAASPLRDLRNGNSQPLLGLAGYAESRPRPDRPGEDAGNRRIEVRFLLAAQQVTITDKLRTLDEIIDQLRRIKSPSP